MRRKEISKIPTFSPSAAEVVAHIGYVGGGGTEGTDKEQQPPWEDESTDSTVFNLQPEPISDTPLCTGRSGEMPSQHILSSSPDNLQPVPVSDTPLCAGGREIRIIKKKIGAAWAEEWSSYGKGEATRRFFPRPECRESVKISTLPHQAVQVLTGHSFLNAHQHRFGFRMSPNCECGNTPETEEHFIFRCPLFRREREKFHSDCLGSFDKWPPTLESLHKAPTVFQEMVRFIKKTNRLGGLTQTRRTRANRRTASR